jgi:hypothetical protein
MKSLWPCIWLLWPASRLLDIRKRVLGEVMLWRAYDQLYQAAPGGVG